ncbi:bifunctional protein FolD 4, chloroplastic isoform X2 [Amborella trichopoda]|uniref:bifunctional protein FolD 4, chloroplastic isoform X2 n=1 Tax=Amborella trichopoda TaxID=13333 RepID=UPI0009BF4A4C|nr:bifunctional protein FolD 4, chloroplastic isoform X2 [Amborella trichopoda]|eukprot:XP_020529463.1 bifunctional protein FolD 4, chloroplastic isoform X2 [Amborella trichopoda]
MESLTFKSAANSLYFHSPKHSSIKASRLQFFRSSSTAPYHSFLPERHASLSPSIGLKLHEICVNPIMAVQDASLASEPVAIVIDGKSIAKQIRNEIAVEVSRVKDALGIVPGLAVILVGSRPDSQTYVRNKKKACEAVGITSQEVHLPEDSSEEEVLTAVSRFNVDPTVHGILIQLPLPKHMNEEKIVNAVSIEKDVDGFNELNIGRLAMQGRAPLFVPCTPKGCIELLTRSGIKIEGKRAVVVGRSNIVGTPVALLLQRHNATVSIVHSRTNNPAEITREADIVIAAVGVANLVRGNWIKPGAVVIDVGINAVDVRILAIFADLGFSV